MAVVSKTPGLALLALLCVLQAGRARAQRILPPERIPSTFTADAVFAARIRSLVRPYTDPASGQFATGKEVMHKLLKQLPADAASFSWDLRIAKDAGNVFSSPDGTIFVDESLAQMLGPRPGLWAAALSHEISHVVRRDWARRYLFQQALQAAGASQIMLGDGGSSGSWVDPRAASEEFASFCRATELEADAAGLMLMIRAGFHPDFVPALHHLIEAQPRQSDAKQLDSSHPHWEERDQKLLKLHAEAGMQYDQLWPDRYASPGGDPPIVVYADATSAKRSRTGELEVLTPLHCENLSGSVEVVLDLTDPSSDLPSELRQFTGCTSNRTLITFTLPNRKGEPRAKAEISVLDANGTLLTRTRASIPAR